MGGQIVLLRSYRGKPKTAWWWKRDDAIVLLIPSRIEILVPVDVDFVGVIVFAQDVSGRPAIGSNPMMPLAPGRISLTGGSRNQGARHTKHGKQSLPMAGQH